MAMSCADDPHLVERLARLAAFHELPAPVVVQMTLMAAELLRRPADLVHEEITGRIANLLDRDGRQRRPTLRVIGAVNGTGC